MSPPGTHDLPMAPPHGTRTYGPPMSPPWLMTLYPYPYHPYPVPGTQSPPWLMTLTQSPPWLMTLTQSPPWLMTLTQSPPWLITRYSLTRSPPQLMTLTQSPPRLHIDDPYPIPTAVDDLYPVTIFPVTKPLMYFSVMVLSTAVPTAVHVSDVPLQAN
jgi:hypothetical protein